MEQDLAELEGSLKRSSLESSDLTSGIRRQQDLLRSKTAEVEAARRETDNIRDFLIMAERKVAGLKNAAEETRSMLEQSDRLRRQLEQEVAEKSEEQAKLLFQNTTLGQDKRRLEGDISELQLELEEVKEDLGERETRAKDCMMDASKIAEELHCEQEQSGLLENETKSLESIVKNLHVR